MPRLTAVRRFVSNTGARIYRIACEALPGLSARVYLILGAGPATLVDAGSGEGRCTEQIVAALESIAEEHGEDFQPRRIERILITHAHIDHIGGLADLVGRTGAQVGAHPFDAPVVSDWDEHAAVFNRRLLDFLEQAGVPGERHSALLELFGFAPGRMACVRVDFPLDEQHPLPGLRVIHTPGHSPGHVCIQVGDILLCGDHILARTIPQQWPETLAAFTGLRHYLDSLKKILQTEGTRMALGGHEPPILGVRRRVEEIMAAQERRIERVVEIVGGSPSPPCLVDIAQRIYTRQQGFFELLALIDVGSRVEYLEQLGRLEVANRGELRGGSRQPARYRLSRTDSRITTIAPVGEDA